VGELRQRRAAPLLFIAGGVDHVMPAAVNRSNCEHYTSAAHTDYREFAGRSHWTCGQPGWEEVADYALDWCNEHTGRGLLHYGATPGFN
jgi:alpha-beta hydrolase superfamily lysophospholipase